MKPVRKAVQLVIGAVIILIGFVCLSAMWDFIHILTG